MSYEDDNEFEFLDDEEKANYFNKYNFEVERSISGLKDDDEKAEVIEEFNLRHNYQRTTDGPADGRLNFLEASRAVQQREENMDDGTKSYMTYVDKRDGKGAGAKLLKKSQARPDDGYFDSLKREGHLND